LPPVTSTLRGVFSCASAVTALLLGRAVPAVDACPET
jgi:hypothetical protein